MKSLKILAAAVVTTFSLSFVPQAANANTIFAIHHNGFTSGPLGGGSGITNTYEIDVGLGDLGAEFPGSELAIYCSTPLGAGVCLGKGWLPGSETEIHTMTIHGLQSPRVVEYVANNTLQAWTDYHFDITGAELEEDLLSGIGSDTDFLIVSIVNAIPTTAVHIHDVTVSVANGTTSVWLVFDQPLEPFDLGTNTGSYIVLSLDLSNIGPDVVINQHPSLPVPEPGTLALFGLGLAGLGLARRRKNKQEA